MALIYALGSISRAHFNPAVTIAFAAAKKFKWKDVPTYIIAQLIGAILASSLLRFLFPTSEFLESTLPHASFDDLRAFILETLLTYILMLVIIHVATGTKEIGIMAGIAIEGVVLLEAMFAGPMIMASMNPARSLGSALLSGHWEHQWLYMVVPILGALLAIVSCRLMKIENCCDQC